MGVNTFCRVYQVLSYGLLSLFVRTVTIVFGSGPYSLLQWTVRAAAGKHTDHCRSVLKVTVRNALMVLKKRLNGAEAMN